MPRRASEQDLAPTRLMFNLAHDVMVKFRTDGSCTLEHFGKHEHERALFLDQRSQLLLLDALCHVYKFPSPVASVVKTQEMPEQDDRPQDTMTTDLADMPSLDNVLENDND